MKNSYFEPNSSIKIRRVFSLSILMLLFSGAVFSQEHDHTGTHDTLVHGHMKKNLLSVAVGYAWVSSAAHGTHSTSGTNVFIPSIGLDYFRKVTHRLEFGLMADVELGEYVFVKKDLYRENAALLVGVAVFEPLPHLSLILGGGMEFESHKNLGVMRTGVEFPFSIQDHWILSPSVVYDIKEGINTLTLSFAFGLHF